MKNLLLCKELCVQCTAEKFFLLEIPTNKKPGKKAKKKIETFGFNTFIINPCLNNCAVVLFSTLPFTKIIESSD